MEEQDNLIKFLEEKAKWVRLKTLELHKKCPETRIASSLSTVELFTVLYYGKILNYNPKNAFWDQRDRFIISKAHGAISLYPVLANLGFFSESELDKIGSEGALLGGIPDCRIPGFETINGSLGHGLGVACGMAIALKAKQSNSKVFVLLGDGELYEGAVWEAIMFAAHNKLDNLILIIDLNKLSMLDYCKKILDLTPLEEKFKAFNWEISKVDGHNIRELYSILKKITESKSSKPRVLIADTIKGAGVPQLENDSLSHIRTLTPVQIDKLLEEGRNAK